MAKETGLGANLYIDGVDVSGDTGSVESISKAINTVEATGINKYAMERLPSHLTGKIDWSSFWNPTGAHPVLEDLPRTDRVVTYLHKTTLGTPAACMVAKQINYDPNRAADGSLTAKVNTLSNAYWLDWGLALTAGMRTDGAATNGTGVDFESAANFGAQAYLHVFAFTGTSATIKLQGSSDNGVGDAWADIAGGGFTVVSSAPGAQRIATARNLAVERYMRVVTTGVFTSLIFAVAATVNRTDMTI
jgi:hypothetical protein